MPAFSPSRLRFASALVLTAGLAFGGGWFASRRTLPPAPAAATVVPGPRPAAAAESGANKAGSSGGAVPAPAVQAALPAGAKALLSSLDPGGGLKSHAAILRYASSLDAGAAGALAASFEGKGYSRDMNTGRLQEAVLARWAELDPEAVIQSARTSGDYYHRWTALSAGFDALARRDPAEAWRVASSMGPMKQEAQRSMIQGLSSRDPEAAFGFAARIDSPEGRWTMESVMGAWTERDPAAAAGAATRLPPGQMRATALAGLMDRWAVTDYGAAAAWAGSLSSPQERVTAMTSALSALSRVDPEKSLSLLDSADVGNGRAGVINTAIGALALRDFDGAMARASAFTNFTDKTGALSALVESASDGDRPKLLELAASLPANLARGIWQGSMWQRVYSDPAGLKESLEKIPLASVREQAMAQAVQSMSYHSPDAAADLFGQIQSSSQRPEVAGSIAGRLAQTDPEKALKWAEGLGSEALRKSALAQAFQSWAGADPERAGREIGRISSAETRAEVTRSVAKTLAGRSLAEAERWVGSLKGPDRAAALGSVVEQAAAQAPERVESLYSSFTAALTPEAAARSENQAVARTVASQIAQTDAARAASWSLSLPEGGARDEAVAGVVSTWAGYDAVAASEWLGGLPPGKGRDQAAVNLVNTIARDDPESAWAWAASVGDGARRREAAAAALAGWKANGGREEARAALDAAGFSEEDHRELLRKLE